MKSAPIISPPQSPPLLLERPVEQLVCGNNGPARMAQVSELTGEFEPATMKPGATFINNARGRIVRQDETTRVPRDRSDLIAVLDVLTEKTPVSDDPALSLSNAALTPHIAGSHGPECRRMGAMVLDDFQRWLTGAPRQGRITRETARHLA